MTATTPLTKTAAYGTVLACALAACPSVTEPSAQRDHLMLAIWSAVCTRRSRTVIPMGSVAPVIISSEYATTEFLAAVDWLRLHEKEARDLAPDQLYRTMRAVATLGMNGSGRAARADQLRGLAGVPAGIPIRWADVDDERGAS